jgi:hypothetical protein
VLLIRAKGGRGGEGGGGGGAAGPASAGRAIVRWRQASPPPVGLFVLYVCTCSGFPWRFTGCQILINIL